MDGNVEPCPARTESLPEQTLDYPHSTGHLKATANIVEKTRRETRLSRMTDSIHVFDTQKVRNVVRCPYHQPVGIKRQQKAEGLYRSEDVNRFTIARRQRHLL